MNLVSLEFKDEEQNESYQNYVQIKGKLYNFTQISYSLFWQVITGIKAITSLSNYLLGILIFINCFIQFSSLILYQKNTSLFKKISSVGILAYVIIFSIGFVQYGNDNPNVYNQIEMIHISFNMSLVLHNMSNIVKNWFLRSIILFLPLIIILFVNSVPQDSFLTEIIMTFINIFLTILLIYLDELNLMISYDYEFKQRHQLQEWKNLIEKYIPHEIVIVRKVPVTDAPIENTTIKQKNKEKYQNNIPSTLKNQPQLNNGKSYSNKQQQIKQRNQGQIQLQEVQKGQNNVNAYQQADDVYLNNGKVIQTEQKNLTQSLFQDIQNEASIQNLKELERGFEESQRQFQLKYIQNKQYVLNTNDNMSIDKIKSNIFQYQSQSKKNNLDDDNQIQNQGINNQPLSKQIQNNHQIVNYRKYLEENDEYNNSQNNQNTINHQSQQNIINFESSNNYSISVSRQDKQNVNNLQKNINKTKNSSIRKDNNDSNQIFNTNNKNQISKFTSDLSKDHKNDSLQNNQYFSDIQLRQQIFNQLNSSQALDSEKYDSQGDYNQKKNSLIINSKQQNAQYYNNQQNLYQSFIKQNNLLQPPIQQYFPQNNNIQQNSSLQNNTQENYIQQNNTSQYDIFQNNISQNINKQNLIQQKNSKQFRKHSNKQSTLQSNYSQKKNNIIDFNEYSQSQSAQKISQNLTQKEHYSYRRESTSLENNEFEIINNYRDMINGQVQSRQNRFEKQQKKQRHHSFNVINTNKSNHCQFFPQIKRRSFNSLAQISQQQSISININQNQIGNVSQNNAESCHTRTVSQNTDQFQYYLNDPKHPNLQPYSYLNIFPPYVMSEEVIYSNKNIIPPSTNVVVDNLSQKQQNDIFKISHDDTLYKFDVYNANKTNNQIISELNSLSNGKDQGRDFNFQTDSPLNKKQHFISELMASNLILSEQDAIKGQNNNDSNIKNTEQFDEPPISTNRPLIQNDYTYEQQDQMQNNQNKFKQGIFNRKKSQTLYEKQINFSVPQRKTDKLENNDNNPYFQKSAHQNKKYNSKTQKSIKTPSKLKSKDTHITINTLKQQNADKDRQKKLSISIQADDYYGIKENAFKITFPQINSRFVSSFGQEEDEIKRRLEHIVKDNVSIYERIQEYFQSNYMNVHRSTSLQIGESNIDFSKRIASNDYNNNNIFSHKVNYNQNVPSDYQNQNNNNNLAIVNHANNNNVDKQKRSESNKNVQNQDQNMNKNDNKTISNGQGQDLNQRDILFQFLGCYDSVSKKYYDIKIIPMLFEQSYSSLMIHFNDISDSVMNQRLQQAQKYKDLMLASISHDLRTPLNFIKLMTEKCEEENNLDTIQGILPMIKSNCEMLMSLINDILDHQQMQEGKFRLVPSNFSVNTLFDEIFLLFKIQSEEKNIKIQRKIDQNVNINSDKNRLKQILINLMSNAIKYTTKGEIKISANLSNDCNLLNISVKDSGCGIPQNLQDKLFQVYSTFDHAGGTNKHGVGLGLSLCRGLVSQLGPYHKIDLVSKQGKGSKFSFKIWSNLEGHQQNQMKVSLDMEKILHESIENSQRLSHNKVKENSNDLDQIREVQDDQLSSISSSDKGDNSFDHQEQFDELPNDKNLNLTPDSRVRCYTSFSSQKLNKKQQDILHSSNQLTSPINTIGKSTFLKHHVSHNQQKSDPLTENLREILSHFKRLLIVDDTVFNIIALKIWLKNFSIQIDTANDGREAYTKYQKNHYDLILMDIQMPIMDGYQSTKLIRQYEQQNNLQRSVILIVSAFTSQDDVNKCINVGADDHISKPIERPIFCQVLKKHLQTNLKDKKVE